jgi:arylsulfatase A-like enzyme
VKDRLSRREFLKVLGLLPLTYLSSHIKPSYTTGESGQKLNILIILFDAFSAHNISLYGYHRKTTPNIERLANQAIVYHNHYAAGNFTTPGTASLLTGTYPWTHRALQINSQVYEKVQTNNIYALFNDYHRITYSHNQLVNILQAPFSGDINHNKPREDLTLGENKWVSQIFRSDEDAATVSWARAIGKTEAGYASSLFLSNIFKSLNDRRNERMALDFPLGLPVSSLDNYLLEDAVDWLISEIKDYPTPFLGYFHFLPPHAPYHTRQEFVGAFENTPIPNPQKPRHPLARKGRAKREYGLEIYRQTYDEFILYVDHEFHRLYQALERAGVTENTIIILTTDHGEMFERDILGHTTPSLHDPLLRIPLLIFEPGREERIDIHSNTSAVDLLPTLLYFTGKPIPPWIEGCVLPPNNSTLENRSIFALDAKTNNPLKPLKSASAMIIKERYKLTEYFGYRFLPRGDTLIELFDIDNDYQEMNDLYETHPEIVNQLRRELNQRIQITDEPFQE